MSETATATETSSIQGSWGWQSPFEPSASTLQTTEHRVSEVEPSGFFFGDTFETWQETLLDANSVDTEAPVVRALYTDLLAETEQWSQDDGTERISTNALIAAVRLAEAAVDLGFNVAIAGYGSDDGGVVLDIDSVGSYDRISIVVPPNGINPKAFYISDGKVTAYGLESAARYRLAHLLQVLCNN